MQPVRLPVFATVGEAFLFPLRHPLILLKLFGVPIALTACLVAAIYYTEPPPGEEGGLTNALFAMTAGFFGVGDLVFLFFMLVCIPAITGWHRTAIFTTKSKSKRARLYYRVSKSEFKYLLFFIAFWIITTIVEWIFAGVFLVGGFATMGGALGLAELGADAAVPIGVALLVIAGFAVAALITVFVLRISLVFPAASCGMRYSFDKSWSDTAGNGVRLLLSTIFFFLFAALVVVATQYAFSANLLLPHDMQAAIGDWGLWGRFVLLGVVWLYGVLAGISWLSFVFRTLVVIPAVKAKQTRIAFD